MISILCDKHKTEIESKRISAGYPAQITSETHGHLPDEELESLLIAVAGISVNNETCPDCKLYGLSKQGVIGQLKSPNDWIFI
jgi:hypothetical protein